MEQYIQVSQVNNSSISHCPEGTALLSQVNNSSISISHCPEGTALLINRVRSARIDDVLSLPAARRDAHLLLTSKRCWYGKGASLDFRLPLSRLGIARASSVSALAAPSVRAAFPRLSVPALRYACTGLLRSVVPSGHIHLRNLSKYIYIDTVNVTRLSSATISRELKALREIGVLVREGARKNGKWVIINMEDAK